MSEVDTAAIRAVWRRSGMPAEVVRAIGTLCDALDAARAELEDLRRDTYSMSGAGNMDHWCARAEAAEAEREGAVEFWRHWKARAEAAEARITELESQPRGINREEALLWRDERDDLLGWYQQAKKERDEATARIAAALLWADQNDRLELLDKVELRAALTRGTE